MSTNSDSAGPLHFTRLRLQRWRNFVDVELHLARRTFLVGPTASGKSNLLDAFRFLRDIAAVGGGFQAAVDGPARGGVSSIRCLSARRTPDIVVEVDVGNHAESAIWSYQLKFSQDSKRKRPSIVSEMVKHDGATILNRPDKEDSRDPDRLTQTHIEQVNTNIEFRALADFFASIRYIHIVPQLIREPDRSVGRRDDPFGGDFIEQIARTSKRTREARLRRIRSALQVAVPQLQELELWTDAIKGVAHLRGKYAHWRPQGAWQTEERFSDGTLRLLGLLWALLQEGGPLLLEEPELSLHAEVAKYVPQMFARMQQRSGRQVLVSTHSEALLADEGIGLHEVHLLIPEGEGTTVTQAGSIEEIRQLLEGGLTMGQAVLPRTSPKDARQLVLSL